MATATTLDARSVLDFALTEAARKADLQERTAQWETTAAGG
ncbi:hypothetical protein ACFVYP_36710 [Kitasatospora sp. NPDC058201]